MSDQLIRTRTTVTSQQVLAAIEALEEAAATLRALGEQRAAAFAQRHATVCDLRHAGLTIGQIADIAGISRVRASQLASQEPPGRADGGQG